MSTTFQDFIDALAYAADKHQRQRRKDPRELPYINHPIEAVDILVNTAGIDDFAVLTAAILHDTIEDTDATAEELTARFGEEVCGLVLEVSDDKRLPKLERKRLQIDLATQRSPRARLLILADKICNIRDLVHHMPVGWTEARRAAYFQWAKQVVDQLRGTNAPMEALFDQLYEAGPQTASDDGETNTRRTDPP